MTSYNVTRGGKKGGMTLQELAAEVTRRQKEKRDFYAPANKLQIATQLPDGDGVRRQALHIEGIDAGPFTLDHLALRQIGTHLDVPAKFADRLREKEPDLHDNLFNELLRRNRVKNDIPVRLVRTLDGRARAFLSDSYQIRDNFDLLEGILPALGELPFGSEIFSTSITDRKLYLEVTFPGLELDIQDFVDPSVHRRPNRGEPDILRSGFALSNSEVGLGRIEVKPFLERLICINGVVVSEALFRSAHVGRKTSRDDVEIWEVLSDEAKKADDGAFMLKVRDVVMSMAEKTKFETVVRRMAEASGEKIEKPADKAVEELANQFTLTEGESGGILNHLIEGGELTRYGLMNAVTRAAQDVGDYDRAMELEALGGKIINLPRSSWQAVAAK
ncbi:MAG: hypothetical protein JSW58_08545 [Candidatus Latescibacterota bacterium]|nr:MAG: hypothetical protein JSW58_08545 [Candidatus Latescibacterota bacterium]